MINSTCSRHIYRTARMDHEVANRMCERMRFWLQAARKGSAGGHCPEEVLVVGDDFDILANEGLIQTYQQMLTEAYGPVKIVKGRFL